jgi:hypothetical protein
MTSDSSGDRAYLVTRLEQARSQLLAAIQGLSEKQLTQRGAVGEWSVKDVLAHIVSWEETAAPDLTRLARGDTPVLESIDLYAANFDPMNAAIMSLRRNLPLDQVLRELIISHADFMAAVARLPESVLADGRFGRVLVQITAEHDEEHAQHIADWRKKER